MSRVFCSAHENAFAYTTPGDGLGSAGKGLGDTVSGVSKGVGDTTSAAGDSAKSGLDSIGGKKQDAQNPLGL